MNERRTSIRHLVNLTVTLYHEELGHIRGQIRDISSGGMNVDIADKTTLTKKFSNEILIVRPTNMDVLFNMECLRIDGACVSLKFME